MVAMISPEISWSKYLELSEDDSLIVELRLSRFTLSDAAIAYHFDDATYISFQDIVDALDYPIEVNSEDGIASGWFLSKENTFELNIKKNEVYIRGNKQVLSDAFLYSWRLACGCRQVRRRRPRRPARVAGPAVADAGCDPPCRAFGSPTPHPAARSIRPIPREACASRARPLHATQ